MTKNELADKVIKLERLLGNEAPSLENYRRQLQGLKKADLTERVTRMEAKLARQN